MCSLRIYDFSTKFLKAIRNFIDCFLNAPGIRKAIIFIAPLKVTEDHICLVIWSFDKSNPFVLSLEIIC